MGVHCLASILKETQHIFPTCIFLFFSLLFCPQPQVMDFCGDTGTAGLGGLVTKEKLALWAELEWEGSKEIRRQGRSFQSAQLSLEVSHDGACKVPCPGMEDLGQFQAFDSRATNSGPCVHDFFQCAGKL